MQILVSTRDRFWQLVVGVKNIKNGGHLAQTDGKRTLMAPDGCV